MDKKKVSDCNTCVHGYFEAFDFTGWHDLCGAYHCYLCQMNSGGECPDYEEGKPPEGKEPMWGRSEGE